LSLAVAYQDLEFNYKVKGLFNIGPNESFSYPFESKLNVVYWIANNSSDSRVWEGNDASITFCVNETKAFEHTVSGFSLSCNAQKNEIAKRFHRLKLNSATGHVQNITR